MVRVIKKILTGLIGSDKDFTFEERLILSYLLFTTIICFISSLLNILAGLGQGTDIVVSIATIIFGTTFFFGRVYKKTHMAKLLFCVFALIFCNFYWYFNYGSRGSGTYLFLVYYFILVFAFDNRQMQRIILFILLNILILFGIEMANPAIIPNYPSEHLRVADSYMTLIFILGFSAIIIVNAKNNYIKQYKLAQHSDKLKSAFLANMSHEIRTPLNAIMGFTNLLAERELSKAKKEQYAKLVNDSGNYLMKLVADILDVSMIESGQLKINPHVTELSELFERIYQNQKQIYRDIKSSEVKLILSVPPETMEIETDDIRLEQVVSNLVSNAMKFTTDGYIRFGYIPDDNYILIFVEDTGTGIKEEFQPEIFNRFVKDESAADQRLARGAGIGLSLCRDLVHMLGGKIWFTSEYLKGTTFYFSIPQKMEVLS